MSASDRTVGRDEVSGFFERLEAFLVATSQELDVSGFEVLGCLEMAAHRIRDRLNEEDEADED